MPLQFKNIAVGNLQDDVSGNNYAANKAVYILNLNNTLAQIFSDEAGTIPIVQDGVNNVTGARGVFGFWVEAGDYFVQVGANKYRVSITGADYFNNRIDETVNLIVDAVSGRGAYYPVGSFEVGFTYTDINQVGTFGGTDYYIYTGGLTNLPHNVTAGTDPTLSSDYAQVFYTDHNALTNRNADDAHQAIAISLANGGNVETAIRYVTPEMLGGLQQAIDFCEANQSVTLVLYGEYDQGLTPVTITSPFTILSNAVITFDYNFTGTALKFGVEGSNLTTTANDRKMDVQGNLSIIKARDGSNQPRWWTDFANDDSRGIELWNNSECNYGNITVDGFRANFGMCSDTSAGCVRNAIQALYSTNGASNFNIRITDNVGFVNENDIYGGTLGNSTATPAAVRSSMTSCNLNAGEVTFKPNGNNFWSVTMENGVSDTLIDINGFQNSFRECRCEYVKAGAIKLRSGSENNIFDSNFGALYGTAAFDDQSGRKNNFIGFGTQFHWSYSSVVGAYTGANHTTTTNGGKAGYPVFTAFDHNDPNKLAAALSETGLYTFNPTNNDHPVFWSDGVGKKLWLGSGFFPITDGQGVRASTDKKTLLWDSQESGNSYAAHRMSGSWEEPHEWVNTAGTIYYQWIDTSDNMRAKKGSKPTSDTDGTVISAAPIA